MTRLEQVRRKYCARCQRVTAHNVTTYLDNPVKPEVVAFCTECGE